jgi:hypothetical protein
MNAGGCNPNSNPKLRIYQDICRYFDLCFRDLCIHDTVRWMRDNKVAYLEATEKGMDDWIEHVREWQRLAGELANEVDSWMGVNTTLAHKQKRSMVRYYGPAPGYRRRCDEVKGKVYADFNVKRRCELGRW